MGKCYDCIHGYWAFVAPGEDYEFECLCPNECTTKNGHKEFKPKEEKQ